MGQLTPGATYIYERADGVVYAREFGKTERTAIGYDADSCHSRNVSIWPEIMAEATTNPTLQKALDHVIMIYKLSKDKIE